MNKTDFSKLGFNSYQSIDLQIMMSLKTPAEMQEWMSAVGDKDVAYGLNLLQTACEMQILEDIDTAVGNMSGFIEANLVINGVK